MLDEIEQAVVSPLDVLEHEHDCVLLGERLEVAPPRDECFFLRAHGVTGLAYERTQMREHPLRVFFDQLLDRARELRFDVVVAVGLEDPRLRLHHLRQRPVADALAVGKRPSLPPVRQLPAALDRLEQLAGETALADPRHADQSDELR